MEEEDPHNHMEKPCEICGDVGFDAVIRICIKCKNTREHAYCMRAVYKGEADTWVCEECETPTSKSLFKLAPAEQTNFTRMRASIKKPPQNTKTKYLTLTEAMGLDGGSVRNNYTPTRKPSSSSRPAMNMSSPRKESVRSMPQNCNAQLSPETGPPGFTKILNSMTMRSTSIIKNASPSKATAGPGTGFSGRESRVPGPAVAKEKMKNTSRYLQWETESPLPPRKIHKSNTHLRHSSQPLPQGLTSGSPGVRTNHQPRKVDSGERESAEVATQLDKRLPNHASPSPTTNVNSREMVLGEISTKLDSRFPNHPAFPTRNVGSRETESAEIAMKLDKSLPNHPSVSPTWKGHFKLPSNIVPCGFIGGIQAHPPSKVYIKSYTLSKQLPESLKFEPLVRLSVWTDLFEDDAPGELDIDLYFLPSIRNYPSYACLVEFLDRYDILIKTQMDGVELFIFSSKHLKEKYQRLNQGHFLWGIFYSLDEDVVPSTSTFALNTLALARYSDHRPLPGTNGEDMIVDMIGGVELLESADIVIPKPKEAHSEPIGFSSPVKVKKERTSPVLAFEAIQEGLSRALLEHFDQFTQIRNASGRTLEVKREGEN